jgi:hypothetical protein
MQKGAPNNWRDAAVLQSGRPCETTKKSQKADRKPMPVVGRAQDFHWRQNLNLF